MAPEDATIDLRSYLKVLSRRRWMIAATFLTVITATAVVTWRMTPIYEGVAKVEIQPTSTSSTEASRLLESVVDPTRRLQTQVEIAGSDEVLKIAAKELGLSSTEPLLNSLSVELLPDTEIIRVAVEHERPDEARSWTNAVAEAYITFRREQALDRAVRAGRALASDVEVVKAQIADLDNELQQSPPNASSLRSERDRAILQLNSLENTLRQLPEAEELQEGGGSVITPAVLPTEPVQPKKALNLALAVVVGATLALGLALLAENLDDRMKNPEEVEERVGAPVLGYIPLVKEWQETRRSGLAITSATASGAAEAYRTLRTNLRFVSLERPLQVILVTSPVAEAGKSTAAANLAATLAQGGSHVVLVSADLRRPSVHKIFGLSNSKGLLDALSTDFPLQEALQKHELKNFRLLATGGLPPNPTEILGSERFTELLTRLRKLAEYVVIDAPPVLGLGDSSALASKVDGILMVVRTGSVTKREVSHATDQLRKGGGRVVGCVLNAVEADQGYGYYYHYYYSQYQEVGNGNGTKSPPEIMSDDHDALVKHP
jgi:succinoglycan biosynthesis transport protein ExoP